MKTKIFLLLTLFIVMVGALSFTVLLSRSEVVKKKYKNSKLFSKGDNSNEKITNFNTRLNTHDSTANGLKKAIKPIESPVKIQNKKTVDCREKGGNMESGLVTECLFKSYNLAEAYSEFRTRNKANDDGKYLEEKMPSNKYKATFSDYPTSITYNYPKENILEVEILFPGGSTIISFLREKEDVKVTTNHSPD
mgnify:CR=1 FL=1